MRLSFYIESMTGMLFMMVGVLERNKSRYTEQFAVFICKVLLSAKKIFHKSNSFLFQTDHGCMQKSAHGRNLESCTLDNYTQITCQVQRRASTHRRSLTHQSTSKMKTYASPSSFPRQPIPSPSQTPPKTPPPQHPSPSIFLSSSSVHPPFPLHRTRDAYTLIPIHMPQSHHPTAAQAASAPTPSSYTPAPRSPQFATTAANKKRSGIVAKISARLFCKVKRNW